ncbi:MAG: GNAT family N-acetyltransferase [Gammaproteobacteria bacterium]|nr:GNAT family N-acetyltransferase [Gammaproteobacteria bacterium]
MLAIVEGSGQFDADGLEHVRAALDEHLAEPGRSLWYTAIDDEPVGVAYCAPEPVARGTWNLLMLWLKPGHERQGHGRALVRRIEQELRDRGARLLIVETSRQDAFAAARSFYSALGFVLEAEIKDFFDAGDDKLVYTKPVARC